MSLPTTNFEPGFHITRASHVVCTVRDLGASRRFYEEVIGLILTLEEDDTLYFRGVEEACHHSLVLRKSRTGERACQRIGMRMFTERHLEKAHDYFSSAGCEASWAEVPHQGKTLHVTDPFGIALEFCARMPLVPRQITKFNLHKGGCAQRIDHYQLLTPDA